MKMDSAWFPKAFLTGFFMLLPSPFIVVPPSLPGRVHTGRDKGRPDLEDFIA